MPWSVQDHVGYGYVGDIEGYYLQLGGLMTWHPNEM